MTIPPVGYSETSGFFAAVSVAVKTTCMSNGSNISPKRIAHTQVWDASSIHLAKLLIEILLSTVTEPLIDNRDIRVYVL
jgi:hypothetical protein